MLAEISYSLTSGDCDNGEPIKALRMLSMRCLVDYWSFKLIKFVSIRLHWLCHWQYNLSNCFSSAQRPYLRTRNVWAPESDEHSVHDFPIAVRYAQETFTTLDPFPGFPLRPLPTDFQLDFHSSGTRRSGWTSRVSSTPLQACAGSPDQPLRYPAGLCA